MTNKLVLMSVGLGLIASATATADWFPGDPFKMHFPQLPDPNGWDVNATFPNVVADDWQCIESGRVTDFHIWGSWERDLPGQILNLHLSIHDNIPADDITPYSRPGNRLWQIDLDPSQFTIVDWGQGDQGWFDPFLNESRRPDHMLFHQINVVDIPDPFVQERDKIYWLDVSVTLEDPMTRWGWKTSLDHFMDDAVYSEFFTRVDLWQELIDPETGVSLDMAFVITPSPSALSLVILAGVVGLSSRRRR